MSVRLYELFDTLSFNELVPTLKMICDRDPRRIIGQLPYFKMAFDELKKIQPLINDDVISIDLSGLFVRVKGCQDHWSIVHGKVINLAPETALSDSELAAHILWEITFFGYSENEMMESSGHECYYEPEWHNNI